MNHIHGVFCAFAAALVLSGSCCPADGAGLPSAVVVLVRHAEKPASGDGLTPAGEARAQSYAGYFQNFTFHSEPVKFDAVFAAADSKSSRRPRLTITPAATALGLSVNTSYKAKDYPALVSALSARHAGGSILVCWHHGGMTDLLRAFGADPGALLPGGRWPDGEYDWVIVLRYDYDGRLKDAERINAGLTTGSRR